LQRTPTAADKHVVLSKRSVIALSIVTGVALELGVYAVSGQDEAWDSDEFWTVGLPLACLASLLIGLRSMRGDWRWTILVAPSQVATMMVRSGDIGNLWPLTLVLSAILSAPFVCAAFLGTKLRRTRAGQAPA
jgi:hypothetical protein